MKDCVCNWKYEDTISCCCVEAREFDNDTLVCKLDFFHPIAKTFKPNIQAHALYVLDYQMTIIYIAIIDVVSSLFNLSSFAAKVLMIISCEG